MGLNSIHDRANLLRALFEGVAFSHRTHIGRLRALNPALGTARIAGGAANSRVWAQMFADALKIH